MMCDTKMNKHECKPNGCTPDLLNQEKLNEYKEYLERELEVVNKTLQDIKEDADS